MLIYDVLLFCPQWKILREDAPFCVDESKVERRKPPFDALGKTCCLTILNVCNASFFLTTNV